MLVWEHMVYELNFGVEKEIAQKRASEIKSMDELVGICRSVIYRKCFLRTYLLFPKIEDLKEEEKKELKDLVIKMFPGKGVEELVENCKIVYTAGKLI